MKIGIIGVGNIGGTLARHLATQGHNVRVANSKGAEGVKAFADEIGATAADARGAVQDADLVILSIPFPAVAQLPKDMWGAIPETSPIVDTGNYYPGMRDANIPEIDSGEAETVWVSRQIGRPVIKAFNNIAAYALAKLGRPSGSPGRLAIPVAGDDPVTKSIVMDLIDKLGFDPLDSGTLADSWRQEPFTPVYGCAYDAETSRKALGLAIKGKARPRMPELAPLLAPIFAEANGDQFVERLYEKGTEVCRSFNPLD